MNDAQLIARAAQAKTIIESDIYQSAWDACRAAIFAKIESTPMGDNRTLEDLHRYLKLITSAKANLDGFIRLGKGAEIRMLEQEERKEGKVHLFRP